ncbi:MAG: DivIVA domain-containing protein [Pseudonocardiaceae bacterium]|nr:MAG: DivIVA domain-containing protein [Pseudonocardiaceae bacterium]
MGTALIYLLVVVVVAAVVYALAVAVFGRGEELPPLAEGETPTRLPVGHVSGADVRALRIPQAVRGYRMVEVDWVLDRLAGEVERLGAERDELEARLRAVESGEPAPAEDADTPTGGWMLPEGERPPGRHSRAADPDPEPEPDAADPETPAAAWSPEPSPTDEGDHVNGQVDGSAVGAGRPRGVHRAQEST